MSQPTVCILGSGTMGAGIAQVAATHGWNVLLRDVSDDLPRRAIDGIVRQLDRLVERQKLTAAQRDQAASHLRALPSTGRVPACDLVIEAIVEDFDTKVSVLKPIAAALNEGGFIASNTSSLSITRIADAVGRPDRTIGMHFFNPAPILKLVEIIPGRQTSADVIDRATGIARQWGKTPVRAKDTPGFIVNRVARPFYLEAFRILEEGLAGPGEIDDAVRTLGGFRMGPLELTDLIGQDINTATTRSVWEQLGRPARLAPSNLQESLVAQGHLGRKSGRGVYDYSTDPPAPAINITRQPPAASRELTAAVEEFIARASPLTTHSSPLSSSIFARILAAVINECDWAVHDGVASPGDIDTALKLATNYPRGPLDWAGTIGRDVCRRLLAALNQTAADRRFTPPV
jgi:3-hydroxybutyryl-CoA dehydrogenase